MTKPPERRSLLTPAFWFSLLFGLACILAGVVVACVGPALLTRLGPVGSTTHGLGNANRPR